MIKRYTINKPVENVFPCLSDMQKFADVHPVVYKVEQLGEKEYLFYEKIKILFIPIRFTYNVKIESMEVNKQVSVYSTIIKGIFLHLNFTFETKGSQTEVEETFTIKAPFIIQQLFLLIIVDVHKKLFKNIELLKN